MIARLVSGLLLGLLAGGLVAFGLLRGLGMAVFPGAVLAYIAAAVTGVLTGFIAGRPIWAKGALVESVLKAVVGSLIAAFGIFALRQWGGGILIPSALLTWLDPAIHGPIGELPTVALPAIGGALGAFYGIDNTESGEPPAKASDKKRVSGPGLRVATPGSEDETEDGAGASARRARK